MLDPLLKDKVVLITGANNPCGIGAATARAFAAQGARVFLHYYMGAQGLVIALSQGIRSFRQQCAAHDAADAWQGEH